MKQEKSQPPENQPEEQLPVQQETVQISPALTYPKRPIRTGVVLTIIGYLIFILGVRPGLISLDRSRVIGFFQISVFLIGLGIIVLGSYITLSNLWPQGTKTIAADLGSRLMSTGYVICVFTAMADIFGMGSHPLPDVFFGPLQANGMVIGMATIAFGFLLLIRFKRPELKKTSPDQTNKSRKPSV